MRRRAAPRQGCRRSRIGPLHGRRVGFMVRRDLPGEGPIAHAHAHRPPSGIIGHNDTMLTPHDRVLPLEGIMDPLRPGWPGCVIRFPTSPAMAARFAQAVLVAPAGQGSAGLLDAGLDHVCSVRQGAFTPAAPGRTATLPPGGFACIPAGTAFCASRDGGFAEAARAGSLAGGLRRCMA